MMHWVTSYDENDVILDHVGPINLLRIRRSDDLWVLTGKPKNRPGPYQFITGERKLDDAKQFAEGYEYGAGYDVFD